MAIKCHACMGTGLVTIVHGETDWDEVCEVCADNARLRELLRKHEHCVRGYTERAYCPECREYVPKHKRGCKWSAAIKEIERAKAEDGEK